MVMACLAVNYMDSNMAFDAYLFAVHTLRTGAVLRCITCFPLCIFFPACRAASRHASCERMCCALS